VTTEIHPERLRLFEPDELDAEQRALYDRIVARPRLPGGTPSLIDEAGRLTGPLNAMMLNPAVCGVQLELGTKVRFATRLTDRAREIAILELAVLRRCGFEWIAHSPVGRKAGLTEEELAALLSGAPAPTFDATETIVRDVVRSLVVERGLDDATFAAAIATLGQGKLMDVVAIVTYYDLVALSIAVWQPPLPAGASSPFA
jgi:AhpD family alkylhydroperoxidase